MENKKIIKWVKRGIKFIVTPIIGVVVLFLVYDMVNIKFAGFKLNKISYEDRIKYNIYGPNLLIGRSEKMMEGGFRYKYKSYIQRNLSGYAIFEDEKEISGGILPSYKSTESINEFKILEDLEHDDRISSLGGSRKLMFIRPNEKMIKIKDDKKGIKELGDNEIIEVSISFDKEYKLQDIKENYITDETTFLWIDDKSLLGNEKNERLFLGDEAFGIKIDEENNMRTEKQGERGIEERFIENIESLRSLRSSDEYYEEAYLKLAGEDGQIMKEDISISGVSLVGSKKEIEKYIANKFVKYVFIGEVIRK